jgi:LppX_LprAFG lipoprotein
VLIVTYRGAEVKSFRPRADTRAVRRSFVVCASAFAAAAWLTACGGSALALDPVADAATKTSEVSSYAYDVTATVSVGGRGFALAGRGTTDTKKDASETTFHLAATGLPSGLGGSDIQIVMIGHTIYMRPGALQALPDGKHWLELDLDRAAKARGGQLPSAFGSLGPKQMLQQLLASGDSRKVGSETIDGVRTTHYHVDIDPQKLATVPAKERDAVRRVFAELKTGGIPADVWVDDTGMLRRETVAMQLGGVVRMSMTLNLHDFGTPASVAAPLPTDVYDATNLAPRSVP